MKPKLLSALALVVLTRYVLHSLFVPAYDGPDEPFHVARVLAFSRGPLTAAFQGGVLPTDLVDALSNRPCGKDLSRVFHCKGFPSPGSLFNILREPDETSGGSAVHERNYENQQPPAYYAIAGLTQRVLQIDKPDSALLFERLLSVFFVALALFGPLWRLARDRPPSLAYLFLLALLVPGAAEALARASNDALLFLWVAFTLATLSRNKGRHVLYPLLAAGPLIKLTAFPVVAFVVVTLWRRGHRGPAVTCLTSSLVVFPVQWARGWLGGGTYTYAALGFDETFGETFAGLLRSGWGLAKTAFWVGGWTAFRPPRLLVAAAAMLVVLALVLLRPIRLRSYPEHAAAACVALAGTIFVAIGNRQFVGTWGGLCGWYLWSWSPWIATYLSDTSMPARLPRTPLVLAAVLMVIVANVVWFACASRAYG